MEEEFDEQNMVELLTLMDDFQPLIPDAIIDFYMNKSGLETDDIKLKRLLSLVTQKFVTDIASDALQYSKVRQSSQSQKRKDKKLTLTVEDLSSACKEKGINIKRPSYNL